MNCGLVPNVKKIAVLRSNALGDFIVILPALYALKNSYKEAEIILLGKKWHQEYLKNRLSPVDRVVVVPDIRNISIPADAEDNQDEIKEFIKKMKKERFDIVLHFMGNGTTANSLINQFEAKVTAGFWVPDTDRIDRYIIYYYYQKEVLRYLEAAALVGAKTTSLEPQISVTSSDLDEINQFMELDRPYVVLHTGANDLRRLWPVEKFAAIADLLIDKGYEIVLTGIKPEQDQIEGTLKLIHRKNKVVNLMDKLTYNGLTGLLSNAALYLSTDTGPLHLARAVGCKTIGLYWLPNLINWGPMTNKLHRSAISYKVECPLCGVIPANPWPFHPQSDQCRHLISFIKDISVDEVYSHIINLLED